MKNWLAGSINISGTLEIDNGAINALKHGASLLPSGIQKKVLENSQKET